MEGNALRLDWNEVFKIENGKLKNEVVESVETTTLVETTNCYIIGNPPFLGARVMNEEQKKDVLSVFGEIDEVQDLDYVCGWYKKTALLIQNTNIEVAFVSTNSISQGSQVPILWNVLLNELHVKINFAYQTFKWGSESMDMAHVHCVIVGFSMFDKKDKTIFLADGKMQQEVKNISPYLFEGSNTFVTARKEPLCKVPKMNFGNQPRDGGNFVIDEEEYNELLKKDKTLEKWLHLYIGAEEFLKGKKRWCLWLKNAKPADWINNKILSEKVNAVYEFRQSSKAKTTNGYAKVPHLFAQITQPDDANYLILPRVSSEKRRYIPIGFMTSDVISSDAVQIIPNADLYLFGILTSNVHMAWMRAVAGRLKSDYRYSKEIVYNNFPFPAPTDEQKAKIEKTAKAILDARKNLEGITLGDMYSKIQQLPELNNTHKLNDKAVMEAYGFDIKITESECVAKLFEMYEQLTEKKK